MKKTSKKKMTRFSMAILILVTICWAGTAAADYQFRFPPKTVYPVYRPYLPPNTVSIWYPDLAAGLDFKILYQKSAQYSGDFKIIGEVKNISPKDFSHSGYMRLYRGTTMLKEKPFGAMAGGSSIKLEHEIGEGYYPPKGTAKPTGGQPDYVLKIEYEPIIYPNLVPIFDMPIGIDQNLTNNEARIDQKKMANTLYWQMTNIYRYKIFQDINKHRKNNGLGALVLDPTLTRGAQIYAEWQKANGYGGSGHKGSNWSGAENISSAGVDTVLGPKECQPNCHKNESWANSPGHNANMLGSSWTKVGIGICNAYVVARFQ